MRTINTNQFKNNQTPVSQWEAEKELKQSRKADKKFRANRRNRKVMWEVL